MKNARKEIKKDFLSVNLSETIENFLKKVSKIFLETIENFKKEISKNFSEIAKEYKETIIILEKEIKKLSNFGWTIPMEFTIVETLELIKKTNSKNEIDNYFHGYYMKDEKENFNLLVKEILKDKNISQWELLFKECIEVFKKGKHIITIPALLTIQEGILAKKAERPNEIKMIKVAEKQYKKTEEKSLKKLMWASNFYYIKNIYLSKGFDKKQPEILNRHRVSHGRDQINWQVSDSLRLFQSIHAILKTI